MSENQLKRYWFPNVCVWKQAKQLKYLVQFERYMKQVFERCKHESLLMQAQMPAMACLPWLFKTFKVFYAKVSISLNAGECCINDWQQLTLSATASWLLDGFACKYSTTSVHRPGTFNPSHPLTSSAALRRYLTDTSHERVLHACIRHGM